jgi:hypothetical protein
MAPLKHSLAQEAPAKRYREKTVPDRRQPSLLLQVSGGQKRKADQTTGEAQGGAKNAEKYIDETWLRDRGLLSAGDS